MQRYTPCRIRQRMPHILTQSHSDMPAADCPFCTLPNTRIKLENDLAMAFADGFPVTAGHTLVIPRRHVIDYWGLTDQERQACHDLLAATREAILSSDATVTGFNIGLNAGQSAGQTVFHCHFHLIPRRDCDVSNPRGGVRHVIPGRADYRSDSPTTH